MSKQADDLSAISAIDDLASASPRRMFALSPNDVLVQVSLPLVLILAIVTRLMLIGQALAVQDRGPVILELWKQQLVLRLDRVLGEWEAGSRLPAFPSGSRIQWREALPHDEDFQTLCRAALELDAPRALQLALYRRVLAPSAPSPAAAPEQAYLLEIYDPQFSDPPLHPERIPAEFAMTADRRAYALDYVADRVLQWTRQVENLQWTVVAQCAANLPLAAEADAAQVAAQMRQVAAVLHAQGYPLLRAVREEFEQTP